MNFETVANMILVMLWAFMIAGVSGVLAGILYSLSNRRWLWITSAVCSGIAIIVGLTLFVLLAIG